MPEVCPPSSSETAVSTPPANGKPTISFPPPTSTPAFQLLPTQILLLSLPTLLAHPPNHPLHVASLHASLLSLRHSLSLSPEGVHALTPDLECRAWVMLAEVGLRIIGAGLTGETAPWARGIESEVEKAIGKALPLAQKHPSLRHLKVHLTILHAQLAQWQHNFKFARALLKRIITTHQPTDPQHNLYQAQFALVSHYLLASPPDILSALSTLSAISSISVSHSDTHVTTLCAVSRLRILILAELWEQVDEALADCERRLALDFSSVPSQPTTVVDPSSVAQSAPTSRDPAFITSLKVHTLLLAVVYQTHAGKSAKEMVLPRLAHLHSIMDSGVLDDVSPDGVIEIPLSSSPHLSLRQQGTHPKVLFHLAFLVSSISKRDAAGRNPKRRVFASEGIAVTERLPEEGIDFCVWSSLREADEVRLRLAKIKADMMCELIACCIMRSEFDEAEQLLASLIAHTRTHSCFNLFAGRITLHQAHLVHSLGRHDRAIQCYRVATHLAEVGSFVWIASRAGELGLEIGRGNAASIDAAPIIDACRTSVAGGALQSVGKILEACLAGEIVKAKQFLKQALDIASRTQDNHIRALILAFTASLYVHTAGDHAQMMLQTCRQLASGLGVTPTTDQKGLGTTGNVSLGLYVGERFLELYKRSGQNDKAEKQERLNEELRSAVRKIADRGGGATNYMIMTAR